MNKVFNINLGGQPLTIDEDAYRLLESYLQSLHNHFRQSEGYEEIMSDIEARLGELMREGMGKRAIVMMQDVKNAVSVMGKPEDFGAQPMDDTQKAQEAQNTEGDKKSGKIPIQTGKRMFRDEDNKVIGGVCSGLAAYFGISDPLWVRLAFVIPGFLTGTGVFLYFILLVILPKAKTTADKLAMRGEPIDVNSIAKSVEKGIDDFSHKMSELGSAEGQARFYGEFDGATSRVKGFFEDIFRTFGGLGKAIAVALTVLIVVVILCIWVAIAVGAAWGAPIIGYLTDDKWQATLGVFNIFVLLAVPTLAIILFVRRLVFKRGVGDSVHMAMWTFFGLNCASMGILGGTFAKNYNTTANITQKIEIPNSDILTINYAPSAYNNLHTEFGNVKVSEEYLVNDHIYLNISKSDDGSYSLTKEIFADGRTSDEAQNLVNRVEYTPSVTDGKLTLPSNFIIPKGTKWRDQSVSLVLKVPVGKVIQFKRHAAIHLTDVTGKRREKNYCRKSAVQTWKMTEKGFECVNTAADIKKNDDDDNDDDDE